MKTITSILTVLIGSFFILISCEKDESTDATTTESGQKSTLTADTQTIAKLIDAFDQTLTDVRGSQNKPTEKETDAIFIEKGKNLGLDMFVYTENTILKGSSDAYVSFYEKINTALSYDSSELYKAYLITLDGQVQASSLTTDEKQDLVNKIAFMIEFVNWMESVSQKYSKKPSYSLVRLKTSNPEPNQCNGWWACWGKCMAGTIGGAGTGALAGGIGLAAAGSIAVPIIGAVPGGTFGAVVGGVSGGLTGAAASC